MNLRSIKQLQPGAVETHDVHVAAIAPARRTPVTRPKAALLLQVALLSFTKF